MDTYTSLCVASGDTMTADELNTWFETTIVGKSLITALGLALVIFGGRFGLKVLAHGWRSVRTREWSRLGESKVWARGWLAMVVGAYEMLIGVFFTAGVAAGVGLVAHAWGWTFSLR
jgi:hypothetical protein